MSTLRIDNFAPSAGGTSFGIEGIAKALVYFDQTTPNVVADVNVSSVDDDGLGDFGVNFTNAFVASTYWHCNGGGDGVNTGVNGRAAGAAECIARNLNNSANDYDDNELAFFGDLA